MPTNPLANIMAQAVKPGSVPAPGGKKVPPTPGVTKGQTLTAPAKAAPAVGKPKTTSAAPKAGYPVDRPARPAKNLKG